MIFFKFHYAAYNINIIRINLTIFLEYVPTISSCFVLLFLRLVLILLSSSLTEFSFMMDS